MTGLIIGSCGVGLLLIAFALNLVKKLSEDSFVYLGLNILGSFMAAYYAFEGNNIPFIILELVWGLTAFARLIIRIKKGSLKV